MARESFIESLLLPLLSLSAAFFIGGALILLLGENPFRVYAVFFEHSLLSWKGLSYTLFYATPLIFTGLSVAVGFRCGLFNIGAEGQLYAGSVMIAITALTFPDLPAWALIPLCVFAGFAAGGIWGGIPGMLKAGLGSHEVINTIMMNFIAYAIANYLVLGPFKRENSQLLEMDFIPEPARLANLSQMGGAFQDFARLNAGFPLALLCCALVYFLFWKTKWGYEIRAVGSSPEAARYAGVGVGKNTVLAMLIAGGLAGLIGVHEVLGFRHTYHDNFSGGAGFVGIAVALLARNHPFGIVPAALMFGALNRGGLFLDLQFDELSMDLNQVLQGIIVFCVAAEQFFKKIFKIQNQKRGA